MYQSWVNQLKTLLGLWMVCLMTAHPVLATTNALLESDLEHRVERRLSQIFGEKSKFGITVHIREAQPSADTKAYAEDTAAAVLYAPEDTDEKVLESARGMVQETLSKFKPEITIKKFTPADTSETSDTGGTPSSLLPLALFATGGLILAGMILLGLMLRKSLESLAEGVRSSRADGPSLPMPSASAGVGTMTPGTSKGMTHDKGTSGPLPFLNQNLKVVKQVLKDQPSLLVRELGNMSNAGKGFRWLLLLLTTEEQGSLRKYLGEQRLTQLANESLASGGDDSFDAKSHWLDELSERLTMRLVRGNSPIEAALDTETIVEFLLSDADTVIAAAESVNDKGGWRILAEFLSKEEFQRYLAKSDSAKWKNIVEATDLGKEQIVSAAKRMIENIRNSPSQKSSKADRSRYFQSVLLEPVIAALKRMSLGQQDELVGRLQGVAPDLLPLIEERIWTPRQLHRVPPDYLTEYLKNIAMEQRVAMIVGLPPDLADRMVELLPEGNIKIVVKDQVKNIESRGDERERHQHSEVCRGLIEDLRGKATNREFRLLRPDEVEGDAFSTSADEAQSSEAA